MNQHGDSVMLALLPITTDWSRIEVPHMTLVYAGEKKDLKVTAFNELAKDAAAIAMLSGSIQLRVMGTDVFGSEGEDKVNVFKLLPSSELLAMRRSVEKWNASQHDFTPHVTIGPLGLEPAYTPSHIAFDRICVGWGKEYLTFWLRR